MIYRTYIQYNIRWKDRWKYGLKYRIYVEKRNGHSQIYKKYISQSVGKSTSKGHVEPVHNSLAKRRRRCTIPYKDERGWNFGRKRSIKRFLYQAFASVLEALCQKNWDKIYIELKSNDDKVDIALEENGRIIKSIQVKSTINTFSKSSIQTWLSDLIRDDVGSAKFELF